MKAEFKTKAELDQFLKERGIEYAGYPKFGHWHEGKLIELTVIRRRGLIKLNLPEPYRYIYPYNK